MNILKYLQKGSDGITGFPTSIAVPYIDERNKITYAKYKIKGKIDSHLPEIFNIVYQLDARTISHTAMIVSDNKPKNMRVIRGR